MESNIQIMGISEKNSKSRKEGISNKIIQEKFPALEDMVFQMERAHQLRRTMDANRPTP